MTKNSNWEILPKNLVTFKRGGSLKNLTLGGGGHEKPI